MNPILFQKTRNTRDRSGASRNVPEMTADLNDDTMFSQRLEPSSVLQCDSSHKSSLNKRNGANGCEVSEESRCASRSQAHDYNVYHNCSSSPDAMNGAEKFSQTAGDTAHFPSWASTRYVSFQLNILALIIRPHSSSLAVCGSSAARYSFSIHIYHRHVHSTSINQTPRGPNIGTSERRTYRLTHQSM